jgi:hypothetical protein
LTEVSALHAAWRLAIRVALLGIASLLFLLLLSQQADAASPSSESFDPGNQAPSGAHDREGGRHGFVRASFDRWSAGREKASHGSDDPVSERPVSDSASVTATQTSLWASEDGSEMSALKSGSDQPSATDGVTLDAPASTPTAVESTTSDPVEDTAPASTDTTADETDVTSGDAAAVTDTGTGDTSVVTSTDDSASRSLDAGDGTPTSDSGSVSRPGGAGTTTDGTDPTSGGTVTTDPAAPIMTDTDTAATTTETAAPTTVTPTTNATEPSAAAVATAVVVCPSPTGPAALRIDLAVLAPVVPSFLGPITAAQGFNSLLRNGFAVARAVPWNTPVSGIRSGLTAVFEHVRKVASHTANDSGGPRGAPGPAPAPAPLPSPLPAVPTEQGVGGSGSSISSGTHQHAKGGSAYAVLEGTLLILFLRPLGVSWRCRSSGYSRSFQPPALPG